MTATTIESPATPSVPFRAADVVKHKPTGEEWILANDQTGTDVSPCGWPECWAEAEHCELVKTATDLERLTMLQNWAQITDSRDQRDHRIHDARTQLLHTFSTRAGLDPAALILLSIRALLAQLTTSGTLTFPLRLSPVSDHCPTCPFSQHPIPIASNIIPIIH